MNEIRSNLTDSLEQIEKQLLAMSEEVAVRIGLVTSALLEGDVLSADELIRADDDMDLASLQVEERCIDTIVRQAPVAGDLRFVLSSLHLNSEIERSGDLTTNIAKAVGRLQGARFDERVRDLIVQMSVQAQLLFRRAAESLAGRDADLAASIDELDDVLDDLHIRYIQTVMQDARRGTLEPQQSLQLALVGRFYERIGDHAENIGERVRYIVTGWLPEAQAAERARERHKADPSADEPLRNRGIAVIESLGENRRIDAIRRDFVANVSHELKTPIAAMSLLAETLAGEEDPADRDRLAAMLHKESKRAEAIIDDLLELSRLDEPEGQFAEVHIDMVVARSIDASQSFAEANRIELATVGVPSSITISGDRRQLVRAITNLLDNAVRYSDPDSRVTLTVDDLEDSVEISVRDTGIGIPRPDLERVFERFYRVDRARSRETGGTGLGLAIVRHVVENHGGRVLVDSKSGSGSMFSMRIPKDREES